MNERIKEIRNILQLNQSDFANKIGIGQAGLSAIEKGIRNVTDRNIQLICSAFNVNENWLRTGEGEMFDVLSPDEEMMALIGRLCTDDNDLKRRALHAAAMIIDNDTCWTTIEEILNKCMGTKKE